MLGIVATPSQYGYGYVALNSKSNLHCNPVVFVTKGYSNKPETGVLATLFCMISAKVISQVPWQSGKIEARDKAPFLILLTILFVIKHFVFSRLS